MNRLILASASTRRLSLLRQMGYAPALVVPADIDESEKKSESPKDVVHRLSYEKALKVFSSYPDDIILSADTVVSLGRTILPKALTKETALYCINKMSGRRHRVHTGVCLMSKKGVARRVGFTVVKFKVLSLEDKNEFLETEQWRGKAGGYGLQGFATRFVEYMRGSDTNVVGMPACITHKLLSGAGIKADTSISFELI